MIMTYCDCAAAMPSDPETIAFLAEAVRETGGVNQEAGHRWAYELRRRLDAAAAELAADLTGEPGWRAVWGDCGTGVLAMFGELVCRNRRVVSSRLEHPALAAALERTAAAATYWRPDPAGRLCPDPETARSAEIAAFHWIQSELGTVQDPDRLFAAVPPGCVRFLDAIQGAGKLPFPRSADVAAVSGAKFGAPGGAALLISPRWSGGDALIEAAARFRNTHLGCRPQPAVMLTLAFAARRRRERLESDLAAMRKFNCELRREIAGISGVEFTIPEAAASPYILHLRLPGRQGAVAVRILSELGVAAASGSACASESRRPSEALTALGLRSADAFSGVRLSFSWRTIGEVRPETLAERLQTMLKKY